MYQFQAFGLKAGPVSMGLLAVMLFVLPCIPIKLSGQSKIDTLKLDLAEADNDTIRFTKMLDLGYEYYFEYSDSLDVALSYADQAIAVADRLQVYKARLQGYNLRGKINRDLKNKEAALADHMTAKEIAEAANDSLYMYAMLDNYASTLAKYSEFDKALEIKFEVLDGFRALKREKSEHITLNSIGYIFLKREEYAKAKPYFLKCYKYAPNDIYSLGNLGIVYKRLGDIDSALYFYKRVDEIGGHTRFIIDNKSNIGSLLLDHNKYEEALVYLSQVHDHYKGDTEVEGYWLSLFNKAKALSHCGRNAEALSLIKGLDHENFKSSSLTMQVSLHSVLSQIYELGSKPKAALKEHKMFKMLNDSLLSMDRESRFREIEDKYELKEKEHQIIQQNLELSKSRGNLVFLGSGIIILLLSGLSLFYIQMRNSRNKKLRFEQQMELQDAQIDALKKKNRLIAMNSILEGQEEERKRIARDLHDNIGTLMSTMKMKMLSLQHEHNDNQSTHHQIDEMISKASTEIRRISHNMTPVAFDLTGLPGALEDLAQTLVDEGYEVDEELHDLELIKDKQRGIMIYRIFQEVIHNIRKHSGAAFVKFESWAEGDFVYFILKDNGRGMAPEIWKDSKGMGLRNIKSRIAYLNGEMEVDASSGTEYKFKIPVV